ncbi:ABC transporter permease [Christiangramia forsetii]|uniref:FtsX family membrane protein (Predicted permease) n=2 Tax=Christiangramia forsetii TaxID=411153 RepID=A0LZ96_CHRFK|nr:FtsX-like permease family protein [Christiangramia forsetii]GGG37798.1 ABC transporter permease [Christiangramia forsetii]CAL65691.1 FtsX family membrane protein (predicted permease) [Christiangramia forsetii KT0803]
MFRNYLKIAWRSLWKEKTFTFLNVFGLSVAFGAAILLSIYSLFELSFNKFHEHGDNIFQVYHTEYTPKGPEAGVANPLPFANALKEEVPGVEKITRFNGGGVLASIGENQVRLQSAFVDPEFFSIFTFPVLKGDKNPVSGKSEIALTEKAARILFGDEEALGKNVDIFIDEQEVPFTVTSIIKNIPQESNISFDIALNFKSQSHHAYGRNIGRWDNSNHEVYMQLAEGISPTQFEKSTRDFSKLHYADAFINAKRDGAQPGENGQYIQQRLLSVKDLNFVKIENGLAAPNRTYPYLILGIAFLILFIASINFINMNIAKSSQRLREIGMRKTLGARKTQLFFQFWGESILVFLGAMFLGLLIAYLLLEPFQSLFNTRASYENVISFRNIISFISAVAFITFIAGGYPAMLLSKLGTLKALKGKINLNGGNRVRNTLIVVQFSIAILLISGTLVLWNQLQYMQNKDLGFNKEQVISFPLNGKKDDFRAMQLLRNELNDTPGIKSITAANNILGIGKDHNTTTSIMGFEHKGKVVKTNLLMVDHDYPETVGLELLSGRSFKKSYPSDSLSIVINEAMAKELNEKDILNSSIILDDSIRYSIIGIVKDYNFQSMDKEIEPLTLFLKPLWNLRYAFVSVAPQNLTNSFNDVKNAWNKIEPNAEFMGSFLDENIDRTLERERNMTTMITSGSVIAIILSCVGLFAISLLVVSQRRKEIGIRKVVGASASRITVMLTSDFLKLVGIAFLIATPIAWFFSDKWLQGYPYRMDLNIWIFISAGVLAFIIAILTISFRTIRAAIQNPVKSLRTE